MLRHRYHYDVRPRFAKHPRDRGRIRHIERDTFGHRRAVRRYDRITSGERHSKMRPHEPARPEDKPSRIGRCGHLATYTRAS
ncbi:MAG: hypothetical protein AUH85_11090 [Chloroflexi bacterium 13_1_40CM_4_68_4]|nr:MAG: hypothetical protein AUH85_11090 [Chloroflexi bacterium 13_1_40CM_4_68_4]